MHATQNPHFGPPGSIFLIESGGEGGIRPLRRRHHGDSCVGSPALADAGILPAFLPLAALAPLRIPLRTRLPRLKVAEREGFEPSVQLPVQHLSRVPPSAARPPLRIQPIQFFFSPRAALVSLRILPRASELICYGGGGRIRTHGTFVQRFSRPPPSTTRPLLRSLLSQALSTSSPPM